MTRTFTAKPATRDRVFELSRRVPFAPLYCVSESGKVGRIGSHGWLRPSRAKRGGYLVVGLWRLGRGRTVPVHRIVAAAFLPSKPSPAHEIAHRDGDKEHNHWSNLRWATRRENEHDKIAHGRTNRGERNGSAKITDLQASYIRQRQLARSSGGARLKKGELQKLAAEFGITTSAVWNVINGYRRSAV